MWLRRAVLLMALAGCGDDGGDDDDTPGLDEPIADLELPACGEANLGGWVEYDYALGGVTGSDPVVLDLVTAHGDTVYAAGVFDTAGPIAARNVAGYSETTTQWTALDDGLPGQVEQLAHDGASLWAAGYVDPEVALFYVARFDDGAWAMLAEDVAGRVHDLAAVTGGVAVSGSFEAIGGTSAASLALYADGAWNAVGVGDGAQIHGIASTDDGFCVVGVFTSDELGGVGIANAACWDGDAWTALGSGLPWGELLARDPAGRFFASTAFPFAGGHSIALLDGDTWSSYGDELPAQPRALMADDDGVIVAGSFPQGTHLVPLLRQREAFQGEWTFEGVLDAFNHYGSSWGTGAYAVTEGYVGGAFYGLDEQAAFSVATLDGYAPGYGAGVTGVINGLVVQYGMPAVAGNLATVAAEVGPIGLPERWASGEHAFPPTVQHLAAWNLSMAVAGEFDGDVQHVELLHETRGWSTVPMEAGEEVTAMLVTPGDLLFLAVHTADRASIRRWDGKHLDELGSADGRVAGLLVVDGDLVIYGSFASVDGVAVHHIARRTDGRWRPIGDPGLPITSAAYSPGVGLLATLLERESDGPCHMCAPPWDHLARWDGEDWSRLHQGHIDDFASIDALTACADGIIVGGRFDELADVAIGNLAFYDGASFSAPMAGAGPTSRIALGDREIFVVGGKPSPVTWSNLAAWRY